MLQCFLEESRSLMRIPPRLSTAEADLKVPFQQVIVTDFDRLYNVTVYRPSILLGV